MTPSDDAVPEPLDALRQIRNMIDAPHFTTERKYRIRDLADSVIAAHQSTAAPQKSGCSVCSGDCSAANPPVIYCPMRDALNQIATRTGSDDPCRWMVELARKTLSASPTPPEAP